nr:GNAT family N-acetyltransferase [Novosphingobium piscinae]
MRKASADTAVADLLASAAAPFDRTEWWERLCRHCGFKPLYVLGQSREGVALLPLVEREEGVLAPLANWYTFRWRPLVTPGINPVPMFEAIARDLSEHSWRVSLTGLPEEDGTGSALTRAFRKAGWMTRCVSHDSNHILRVDGRSYADYHATLPGALRTSLKRKSGRVACTIHTAFAEAVWADYEAIYADSWKPEEGSPAFLRAFAEAESAAGRLRLGVASVDGTAVAAQLWTVEAGTAYIHKLAHRESARGASPGTVLSAALFAHVIDVDQVELIDFGTGNDSYKQDWMEDVRPRYHLEALRLSSPNTWLHLSRRLTGQIGGRLARQPAAR